MNTHKGAVYFGILATIFVGCSKSSDRLTTAERSVNGNRVALAEASFDLPSGWKVFDMTRGDFAQAMEAWVASNPQAQNTAEGVKAMARNKDFRLFALDAVHSEVGFADNLNVLVLQRAVPANLEDLLTQTRNQLAALPGATIISPFNREPVGSNEFVHGQINMKRGIGQDLLSDSYSVIRHGKSITFTFTCLKPHAAEFTNTARQTMEGVQLK